MLQSIIRYICAHINVLYMSQNSLNHSVFNFLYYTHLGCLIPLCFTQILVNACAFLPKMCLISTCSQEALKVSLTKLLCVPFSVSIIVYACMVHPGKMAAFIIPLLIIDFLYVWIRTYNKEY